MDARCSGLRSGLRDAGQVDDVADSGGQVADLVAPESGFTALRCLVVSPLMTLAWCGAAVPRMAA